MRHKPQTKGLHLKQAADATYKRSVFNMFSEYGRKADWGEFVQAMRQIGMRFEIEDEEGGRRRLNAMFAAASRK